MSVWQTVIIIIIIIIYVPVLSSRGLKITNKEKKNYNGCNGPAGSYYHHRHYY